MERKHNFNRKRARNIGIIISIIFILLSVRLYYLQFVKAEDLKSGALKQRGREIFISPKRGPIYDRNNNLLTNNEEVPSLVIQKDELIQDEDLYEEVKDKTLLSSNELRDTIKSNEGLLTIPMDQDFKLDNKTNNSFLIDIVKRYDEENLLSHVIGYINKSDNRGKSGIEKVFDEYLNISDLNSFVVEYDKSRKIILGGSYHVNRDSDPNNPSGVKLTIDKEIQKIVEKIMDKKKLDGSIIVAKADDSNILAMVSRPNFDQDRIENNLYEDDMALYNKAIQVAYPPASIFKIVVLLAALESNPSAIKDQYYCKGYEEINNNRTNCNGLHGHISLEEGFAESCNSVFIQLAKEIGAEEVINMAKVLGFGNNINIGLLGETDGNLPKDNELLGPAVGNIAIGQGKIEATALQITNMMMTIVNKGIHKPLNIIEGISNQEGQIIKEYKKEDETRLFKEETSYIVLDMLRQVVKSGTASHLDLEKLGGAGGKTGSAQGVLNQKNTIHGWFTGYFPQQNPKYVITIIIENAESGSKTAAPIFEEIVKGLNAIYP